MIQIFINNEEVLCSNSLEITEEMLNTSSTTLVNCYPKSWEGNKDYVSRFYYPKDYSKCKILKDNELIFCGVVKNTGNISLNPRYPKYCNLQVLDFKTMLSEGETLDFVISNKTIVEAIELVVNSVKDYGVKLGNINILNGDEIIGAYSTLDKTAYDVFQYLTEISGSKWTTRLIDEDTIAVDFYDPSLMEQGKNIEYNEQWFEENGIEDMNFNYSTNDYRNKQIMSSDEVYSGISSIENFISNGYDKKYTTTNNIGELLSIEVNGENKTFATNEDKELGQIADFYYSKGKNEVESDNLYIAGTTISITYTALVKGRQVVYNNSEVNRIKQQTNRKGVISRYENRNDVLSSEELQKVGETYIKYKGNAEVTLTINSLNNIWEVGQTLEFDSPINELIGSYMVKKKITKIYPTANKIFYTYSLSNNYNSENAINYFDNQRNKAKGNIQAGDFVTRNIDVENSVKIIFENQSFVPLTYTGDNVLNCTLDSPFIS